MRRILLLIALFAITFQSNAQEKKIHYRIQASTSIATFINNQNSKFTPGFSLGVIIDYPIIEKFSFQSGLMFVQKGAEVNYDYNYDYDYDYYYYYYGYYDYDYKAKIHSQYLEIPLDFTYKFYKVKNTRLNFFIGSYLAYGISGKYHSKERTNYKLEKKTGNFFEDPKINRFDTGFETGFGLDIKKIYLGLKIQLGIARITDETDNKNFSIMFSGGYSF